MGLTRTQYLKKAAELDAMFGPDSSKILHTFDDGWTIRVCSRYGDVCREGELMRICWRRSYWTERATEDGRVQSNLMDFTFQKVHSGKRRGVQFLKSDPNYNKRIDPQFFSLRDPDNLPHISFYVNQYGDPVYLGGRHNDGVVQKHRDKVLSWRMTGWFVPYLR